MIKINRLKCQFNEFFEENLEQMGHIVDGNSYMLTFKIEADENAELDTSYIKELYLELLKGERKPPKDILKGLQELSKKVNSILRAQVAEPPIEPTKHL